MGSMLPNIAAPWILWVWFVVDWFIFSRLVYRFASQRTYECPHSMAPTSVGHFRWFNCNPRLLQIAQQRGSWSYENRCGTWFLCSLCGSKHVKALFLSIFPHGKKIQKRMSSPCVYIYILRAYIYIYKIIYNVYDICTVYDMIYNHLCTSIIIYTYIWSSKTSSSPWYPIPSCPISIRGRGVKPCSCLWARTRNRFGHGLRRLEELRMVLWVYWYFFTYIYICVCVTQCHVMYWNVINIYIYMYIYIYMCIYIYMYIYI